MNEQDEVSSYVGFEISFEQVKEHQLRAQLAPLAPAVFGCEVASLFKEGEELPNWLQKAIGDFRSIEGTGGLSAFAQKIREFSGRLEEKGGKASIEEDELTSLQLAYLAYLAADAGRQALEEAPMMGRNTYTQEQFSQLANWVLTQAGFEQGAIKVSFDKSFPKEELINGPFLQAVRVARALAVSARRLGQGKANVEISVIGERETEAGTRESKVILEAEYGGKALSQAKAEELFRLPESLDSEPERLSLGVAQAIVREAGGKMGFIRATGEVPHILWATMPLKGVEEECLEKVSREESEPPLDELRDAVRRSPIGPFDLFQLIFSRREKIDFGCPFPVL